MSQWFIKGRTNQHLTWVMVDSTDFATPESALSAATKIKIYGKLRGATGVNFVSSGTGSLTNDIVHAGASVLGIYTIALAKADLSDASAAWYDQYIVSLSATGAAYQTLVVDGGIDASAILAAAVQGNSRVLVVQSQASDAYSAIIAPLASMTSDVASAVWAHTIGARVDSRILVAQSFLSDIRSNVSDLQSDFQSRVPKLVATNSQVSDLHSDLRSYLVVMSAIQSDILSAVSDLQSDFQSRVPKRVATDSQLSDLASDLRSVLIVNQSTASDLYSLVSDLQSDFQSRVPKRVATDSQLSDMASDLKSAMAGITATLSASDISDIASAVWANTIGARVDSRILVGQSYLSDIRSHVSDLQSDFQSRVPKLVATNSQLSDLSSDVKSAVAGITATLSASDISDIASAVWANTIGARVDSRVLVVQSAASDAASAAAQGNSRVLVVQSRLSDLDSRLVSDVSDLYSLLSDLNSNILSRVPKEVASKSLVSDLQSDLRSQISGITVSVGASDISDIASAVWANAIGARVDSRVLVGQSYLSDIRSQVSDLQSDFQSRVPKRVATDSQLSDLHSDLKSHLTVSSGVQSDIYSLLSDLQRDFGSRVPKLVATNSQVSDLASDITSAIGGITVSISASDVSDIASAVVAGLPITSMVSDIYSLAQDIKTQTDKLTFDGDNALDANVQKINDVTLLGDGSATPWGPV